tara:strand:+ start:574 stop:1200 length:627 start_codon:yes stop_codon:yes gene_type:complete
MKRIGLFGGTFDPIHNGHIRMAVEVAENLQLDELRIIPVNQPSHRSRPIASAGQRSEMISSAIKDPLILDNLELQRGGISFTVDTLNYFRAEYPGCSLQMILGEDAFASIKTWHKAEDIFTLTNIVVVSREWDGKEKRESTYSSLGGTLSTHLTDLLDSVGQVYFMRIPSLQISSTEIRRKIRLNKSISGLVPTTVENIILENNLYSL